MLSIVVPAYNEACLLPSMLDSVLSDNILVDCEIIIVCNGCHDNSVEVVDSYANKQQAMLGERNVSIIIIEEIKASKTHALNVGIKRSKGKTLILLDADILVSGKTLRSLAKKLNCSKLKAISPKVYFDVSDSSKIVQFYYQVEQVSTYNQTLRLSNVIALSQDAIKDLEFPNVIADDEFLRRQFKKHELGVLHDCFFEFKVPKDVFSLLSVLSRVERGNYQLNQRGILSRDDTQGVSTSKLSTRAKIVFTLIKVIAKSLAKLQYYFGDNNKWQRDSSTRTSHR